MNQPDPSHPLPPGPAARARQRRMRRQIGGATPGTRAAIIARLSQRAYPSIGFFLLALLCGGMLGAGYLLDSQALLLFSALLAPLMTPWIGLTLSTVTGSARFFFQALTALLIGFALVFLTGLMAGYASRLWYPLALNQAVLHSRLWWEDLFLLAIGAVVLTVSFVRSEEKPVLPSVILAYELFLPLGAAAFGLGSGAAQLWPDGLLVFAIHLAWATLLGVITLSLLGFRPLSLGGYTLGTVIVLAGLVAVIGLSGVGTVVLTQVALPLPVASFTPRLEPSRQPTATLTVRPSVTPTTTLTPRPTLPPTATPTLTPTPQATPVYARISAQMGGGAILRSEPGGEIMTSLENGFLVRVFPQNLSEFNNALWVEVEATLPDGRIVRGWVLQVVLVTATPPPNW